MELKNLLWIEKYRPNIIKNVITPHKDYFLKAIQNPMAIQNFILYSRMGGTGKTSMSKAIVNDLLCDVLNLNASDERSIDTIRSKVKDFMIMRSSNSNSKKCIIMDEGEKLTNDAADALKNMMEEYSANAFVILTTNNIQKIPEPLQTRFKIFEFIQPQKKEIDSFLINICVNEKLEYNQEGIDKLINMYYPSVRKMVNFLQDLFNESKNVYPENVFKNFEAFEHLWKLIQNLDYKKVKNIIITQGFDCGELNKYIFDKMIKNDFDLKKEIKLIQILARNERDMKLGAEKNIVFISSLPEIMNVFELS